MRTVTVNDRVRIPGLEANHPGYLVHSISLDGTKATIMSLAPSDPAKPHPHLVYPVDLLIKVV
jgi:hypothetical protein